MGALFFGLWLIPMGYLVLASRWMPRPLGWILVGGGVGYILSAFVVYVLATVGEFWMIGYLLIEGVREERGAAMTLQERVAA